MGIRGLLQGRERRSAILRLRYLMAGGPKRFCDRPPNQELVIDNKNTP
jgi:hypothetical protein